MNPLFVEFSKVLDMGIIVHDSEEIQFLALLEFIACPAARDFLLCAAISDLARGWTAAVAAGAFAT